MNGPSSAARVERVDGQLARGGGVAHVEGDAARRDVRRLDPLDLAGVLGVDEPAVEQAARRAGAEVAGHSGRAALDAQAVEELVGHAADGGAADDG